MRKILIISVTLFSLTFNSFAGDGDKFVNVSGGLMYRKTAAVLVGMEFETKYHHAWEIYADLTTAFKKCPVDDSYFCEQAFWDYKTVALGVAYKPALCRCVEC
jgi:hypothetical protein